MIVFTLTSWEECSDLLGIYSSRGKADHARRGLIILAGKFKYPRSLAQSYARAAAANHQVEEVKVQ